jgi:hypothetical protein
MGDDQGRNSAQSNWWLPVRYLGDMHVADTAALVEVADGR